jgi:hypothetical protein
LRGGEQIQAVDHEEFRSHDPDEAHAWLRKAYGDHDVKISGSTADFVFSCDITRFDGMTFGRMAHSMAVNVDVFDGLRNLSIIQHREGHPVQVDTGAETVNLQVGDCFLLPPDRPYQAAWNSVSVTLTTLGFEHLQRDATWLVDGEAFEVDFTRPITPAAGRHWSQTIGYVERVVSSSPLLDAAPLARRELSWLVTVQSSRASRTPRWTRSQPPTPATRRSPSAAHWLSSMNMPQTR